MLGEKAATTFLLTCQGLVAKLLFFSQITAPDIRPHVLASEPFLVVKSGGVLEPLFLGLRSSKSSSFSPFGMEVPSRLSTGGNISDKWLTLTLEVHSNLEERGEETGEETFSRSQNQ